MVRKTIPVVVACLLALPGLAAAQNGTVQTGNSNPGPSTSGTNSGNGMNITTGTLTTAQSVNSAADEANGTAKVTTSTAGSMADGSTTGMMNGGDAGASK